MSIIVFSEVPDVTKELLAIGRELADAKEMPLIAVGIANGKEHAEDYIKHGADEVYTIDGETLDVFQVEPYTDALTALVKAVDPAIILIGATKNGNEVAPRLAARLEIGLTTNAVKLRFGDDDKLVTERLGYGGNAMAIETFGALPQAATVPARTFEPIEADDARTGEIKTFDAEIGEPKVKIVNVIEKAREAVRIEDAEVIVSCGRGVKKKEDIAICETLADVLEATIGCSRPIAADLKWLSEDHWVGLSGHKVKPRVYFACGISGQIQHLAGMRDSDTIVAINTDEEAPIFSSADYGVVGDLYKVVPELAKLFKGD